MNPSRCAIWCGTRAAPRAGTMPPGGASSGGGRRMPNSRASRYALSRPRTPVHDPSLLGRWHPRPEDTQDADARLLARWPRAGPGRKCGAHHRGVGARTLGALHPPQQHERTGQQQQYRRAGGNWLRITERTRGDWGPPCLASQDSGVRRQDEPRISRLEPGRVSKIPVSVGESESPQGDFVAAGPPGAGVPHWGLVAIASPQVQAHCPR